MTSPRSRLERALARPRRADLGVRASPVESWDVGVGTLWVKRDDLNADVLGGNKVRALQFLLAGARASGEVLTVGGVGSTHVLSTAVHAGRLGCKANAYRWPHELNPVATRVDVAIREACAYAPVVASPAHACLAATRERWRHHPCWVPFGGTSPLGMCGHVEAALELAGQVEAGLLPEPHTAFVALGSGGTAAGLALGFAVLGMRTRVVAVRCGPSFGLERLWLSWLARRCAALLGVGDLDPSLSLEVSAVAWAGAYGRPHPEARGFAQQYEGTRGLTLDDTYSAKACYAAVRAIPSHDPVLFWNTFDARWLSQ